MMSHVKLALAATLLVGGGAVAQQNTQYQELERAALMSKLYADAFKASEYQSQSATAQALYERVAGLPAFEQFPADSAEELFQRARRELSRRNYRTALDLFRQLQNDYPTSSYVGQAVYFQAFALNRMGAEEDRRRALELLDGLGDEYPDVKDEAASLRMQILGRLGAAGDENALAEVAFLAGQVAAVDQARLGAIAARSNELAARSALLAGQFQRQQDDSEDVKMQALNALLQMDSDAAMPILQRLLQNRTDDNVELRRRAIFLVAQKRGADREEILLDAARNDPDPQVRERAVFHLSQVRTDAAVDALDSILQHSEDERLQERAIFALAQHRSERAGDILRRYARRDDAPEELRVSTIHWIGQRGDNSAFLQELYNELENPELKERVLFAISQRRNEDNAAFLMGIATSDTESIEVRKRALFWVGQMRVADDQLYAMYDRVTEPELLEQLVFVFGQRRDSLAVNQLIRIARDGSNPELQGKAIFWLGQSRDPRAIEVLEEIINREED